MPCTTNMWPLILSGSLAVSQLEEFGSFWPSTLNRMNLTSPSPLHYIRYQDIVVTAKFSCHPTKEIHICIPSDYFLWSILFKNIYEYVCLFCLCLKFHLCTVGTV